MVYSQIERLKKDSKISTSMLRKLQKRGHIDRAEENTPETRFRE